MIGIGINVWTPALYGRGAGAGAAAPEITLLSVGSQNPDDSYPLDLTVSEACTVYMVATQSATQPSSSQVLAGQDHTGASAPSDTVAASGNATYDVDLALTISGTYYLHAVAENEGGTSAVVSSAPFAVAVSIEYSVGATVGDAGWWPTDDPSRMAQNTDGTGEVTDGVAARYLAPRFGNLILTMPTTGASFDDAANLMNTGVGEYFETTFATRGASMYVAAVINSSDGKGALLGGSTSYVGLWDSGSTSTTISSAVTGTPTILVNGAVFSGNRTDLRNAINTGGDVLVEAYGVNLTDATFDTIRPCAYTGAASFEVQGLIGDFLLCDDPGATQRAAIRAEIAARHGITLA